jgi:hypothetical protein
MLRMRRKPPEGLPMIDAGKEWSAMDMEGLFDFYESGRSLAEIAEFVYREVEMRGFWSLETIVSMSNLRPNLSIA